jgi:release factor glutamine methyltransferase
MRKTIREALKQATEALHNAGLEQAHLDATALLSHLLGVDRTFLIAHPEHELSDDQLVALQRLAARRRSREPLQYIVGFQEFFKLRFEVSPGVLIPRPETELIVEAALEVAAQQSSVSILDVGTGSGCLVVSLLHEQRQARAMATDISESALKLAARNSQRHQVRGRLTLVQADGLSALAREARFSIIVSNPPYVPAGDFETLPPEVRDHEPVTALVSGADGLDHIRALLRDAPPIVQKSGYLIFEIGFGQQAAVEKAIDRAEWRLVEIRKDLQGIPRTVVLQRR